jgi:hypothetical protein
MNCGDLNAEKLSVKEAIVFYLRLGAIKQGRVLVVSHVKKLTVFAIGALGYLLLKGRPRC